MGERKMMLRMSLIWGTVLVLCFAALMAMAVITSGPRGDHGRLSCTTDGGNAYTVTITCTTNK